jgi:hypothetical protein
VLPRRRTRGSLVVACFTRNGLIVAPGLSGNTSVFIRRNVPMGRSRPSWPSVLPARRIVPLHIVSLGQALEAPLANKGALSFCRGGTLRKGGRTGRDRPAASRRISARPAALYCMIIFGKSRSTGATPYSKADVRVVWHERVPLGCVAPSWTRSLEASPVDQPQS